MKPARSIRIWLLVAAGLLMGGGSANSDVAFQGLGFLPGDDRSFANGVSDDGLVVVGRSESTLISGTSGRAGFRWSATGGFTGLGTATLAAGVSGDGSTTVGVHYTDPPAFFPKQAVFWNLVGQMFVIEGLGGNGTQTEANAASTDGSVVVGATDSKIFRWTAGGGVVELGSSSQCV